MKKQERVRVAYIRYYRGLYLVVDIDCIYCTAPFSCRTGMPTLRGAISGAKSLGFKQYFWPKNGEVRPTKEASKI